MSEKIGEPDWCEVHNGNDCEKMHEIPLLKEEAEKPEEPEEEETYQRTCRACIIDACVIL